MNKLSNYLPVLLILMSQCLPGSFAAAQASPGPVPDSAKKELLVNIGYHALNNLQASLILQTKAKLNGKFMSVKGARLRLYLDTDTAASLIANLVTDARGNAYTILMPSLKDRWQHAPVHTFIARYDGDAAYAPSTTEASVTRAHLAIDTAAGRTLLVTMTEWKNGTWIPVKGADIIVAVRRSGADLIVSDKPSYTTDSTGVISAAFQREGLPGDSKGQLTIVAKVEDNDIYGSLRLEKTVAWGTIPPFQNNFDDRTLWAARFRTPYWLLFMEYFIFLCVWAVIVFLVIQIIRIRQAGLS